MRKIYYLIILLLYTSPLVQAQTVSGFMKDARTGETLSGVTVINSDGKGNISNAYGFYSIKLGNGKTSLSYECMGYETQNINIDIKRDTIINIMLEVAIMKIDDIIVNSDKKLLKMNSIGGVSMNFSQLKFLPSLMGEQDVFRYMQLLPGVSAGKENTSQLNIRGGSSDQTQIMLDDVPIYSQSHAFGMISIFSGEVIKSAELYKGFSSPMYGGHLSGVASFYMRDGNKYEHKQSIQIGTTTISGSLEGPIKKGKGSYLLSARQFTPHLLSKAVFAVLPDRSELNIPIANFYDVTAKLSYNLNEKNSLYVNFYTGNDAFGGASETAEKDLETDKYNPTYKDKVDVRWGNTIASVRWNSVINSKLFMNNIAYYSFLSNETNNYSRDYTENSLYESTIKSQMDEVGFKSNFDYSVTSNYNITYGVKVSQQFFQPESTISNRNGMIQKKSYDKRNMLTVAGYLNNNFTINKFNFNAGLRVAMYDNSEDVIYSIEPRLSATYTIDESSSTWASYVNNAQPLFSMKKYHLSVPMDYWVPFSGDNIQRSNQISLGYKKTFNNVLDITAEVYYKRSSNISLIYDSDDFLLGEGGVDIAEGTAYGAEFMAQYTKNKFSLMLSYAYSRSENKVDGRVIPFIFDTPHDLNVLAMYDVLKRPGKKHTFSVNIGYKTGRPHTLSSEEYKYFDYDYIYNKGDGQYNSNDYDNSLTNYPKYPNSRLTDYFRVDINYSMEKQKKNGTRTWQISILNATAHNNPNIIFIDDEKYKGYTLIPFLPSFSYKRTF